MAGSSNTKRVLREIVSVEAWHEDFSEACATVELFAEVRFNQAHFGTHFDDKIQFTLQLRQAELVVVPDISGALTIPKTSVRRDKRMASGTTTSVKSSSQNLAGRASTKGNLSASGASASATAEASIEAENMAGHSTSIERQHGEIESEHAIDGDNNHRWFFTPTISETLDGHGWPNTSPILKLRHTNPSGIEAGRIPPTVSILIRCRKDDLEISGLKYLDSGTKKWLTFDVNNKKKLALAHEVIKEELQKEGLLQTACGDVEKQSDKSLFIVADIIATAEWNDG